MRIVWETWCCLQSPSCSLLLFGFLLSSLSPGIWQKPQLDRWLTISSLGFFPSSLYTAQWSFYAIKLIIFAPSVQLLSRVRLLWPHGLQQVKPPCLSPTPRGYSNSCPLRQWCHPFHPLSSPSPPSFNLSQHQGLFRWVSSSHQVAKVLEFQLQHQSFQWIFRTDFL